MANLPLDTGGSSSHVFSYSLCLVKYSLAKGFISAPENMYIYNYKLHYLDICTQIYYNTQPVYYIKLTYLGVLTNNN